MEMTTWLPVAWFAVIGFGVLMYVVLDGFVLGIGILAPMAEDEEQLDIMMNTAAPIWDGNETWLVLGGAGLMAAFPKAYAALLSALYLPVLLLVVALVFRGVAFEFRFKAHRSRRLWSVAFGLGSLLAAFAQGVILGALVQGLQVVDGRYVGGAFSWFSPFSMLTGAAVVFGYALLGSTWLILKTEGREQTFARTLTRPLVVAVIVFMGLVSAWLPFLDSRLMARWFSDGNFWWLSPVPLLTLAVATALWRSAMHPKRDLPPFLLTLALVPVDAGAVRPWLHRPGAGHVAVPAAAEHDVVAGRRAGLVAEFQPGRAGDPAAGDPGLYGMVVPGVPRQGAGGCGVSLRKARWLFPVPCVRGRSDPAGTRREPIPGGSTGAIHGARRSRQGPTALALKGLRRRWEESTA